MPDRTTVVLLVAVVLIVILARCAIPPIEEILKNPVACDAHVTVPDEPPGRPGEVVPLKVVFSSCREVKP